MSATTVAQLADYKAWSLAERLRPLRAPWRSFRRRLLRKPGSTMALLLATVAGGAIITNALALQTERHPSPMFTSLTQDAGQSTAQVESVPLPPARPQAERRADPAAQTAAARDARIARPKDEPQRTASIPVTPKDQMLAIINGSAAEKPAPEATAAPRIAQVQKALNKAGYGPLKADGAFGAGTRAALERFEADRKLPVRGEPQGRTLRELARASGMALD